jgi:hypothetical protein
MNCPDEVAEAVLNIMENAVLSIRLAGHGKNPEYCAVEANHIHNLPGLILRYRKEKLEYYLDAEVPGYVERLKQWTDTSPNAFEEQWRKLTEFLRTSATTGPVSNKDTPPTNKRHC